MFGLDPKLARQRGHAPGGCADPSFRANLHHVGTWTEAAERLQKMLRDGATIDQVEAAAERELDKLTTENREGDQ